MWTQPDSGRVLTANRTEPAQLRNSCSEDHSPQLTCPLWFLELTFVFWPFSCKITNDSVVETFQTLKAAVII